MNTTTDDYLKKLAGISTASANCFVVLMRLNYEPVPLTQNQLVGKYALKQPTISKILEKLSKKGIVKITSHNKQDHYSLQEEYRHTFDDKVQTEISRLLEISPNLTANCYRILFVLLLGDKYSQTELASKLRWNAGSVSKAITRLLRLELIRPDLPNSNKIYFYKPNWERHYSDGTLIV